MNSVKRRVKNILFCQLALIGFLVASGHAQVIYVNASALGGGNGSSWGSAFQSVQAAVNAASAGDEIWVAAGTYHETAVSNTHILLKDGVSLYGGFAGNESTRDQRNPTAHVTDLVGDQGNYTIQMPLAQDLPAVISGFQFDGLAFGVYHSGSSPVGQYVTISNNVFNLLSGGIAGYSFVPTIQQNVFNFPTSAGASASGIVLTGGAPKILSNVLTQPPLPSGSFVQCTGIYIDDNFTTTQAVISNNQITGLTTGIHITNTSPGGPLISNNTILKSVSQGIDVRDASPTIVSNVIQSGNSGIFIQNGTALIINNTIVKTPYALYVAVGSEASLLANNILAFSSAAGIWGGNSQTPVQHNLFFGNAQDYMGTSGGPGDVHQDPLFVNSNADDYHLSNNSPAIDAGQDNVIQNGWTDRDGNARIHGAHVDIGAYESGSTSAPQKPSITLQPQSQSVVVGQSVTFTVTASGTSPLTYVWQKNDQDIPGAANQSSYVISSVALSDSGNYRCAVNNVTNQPATSQEATLTVTSTSQSPLTAPTLNLPAFLPINGQISAIYTGSDPASSFVWSFILVDHIPQGSSALSPGTLNRAPSASFSTSSPQANLALQQLVLGSYQVTVTVLDNNGHSATSAAAYVTLVSADLSSVRVFPNPWRADRAINPFVTFDGLTVNTTIKIFTVSGHWVKTLPVTSDKITWDLTTDSGDKVASGIYVYLMTTDQSLKKTGQIAVIK